MQLNPNRSYTPTTNSVNRSLYLLIPFSEQSRFLILFTLMTSIGLVVGILINEFLLHLINPPFFQYASPSAKALRFLNNLIVGASLAASQWLILRKYIPGWWWIVATGVGWSISAVFASAWFNQIGGVLNSIFYIWLGIAGWLLLRQNVFAARWWLFVAPFSVYVSKLTANIIFLALMQVNVDKISQISPFALILIQKILSAVPLGFIQALSLCTFHKKTDGRYASSISQLDLPLFAATEISDSSQIKTLSEKLHNKIERAWHTKSNLTQKLIYIVAIAADGSIVFYHPVNQPAINNINLTPLPYLVKSQYTSKVASQQSVARFRVVFTPNGRIEIRY